MGIRQFGVMGFSALLSVAILGMAPAAQAARDGHSQGRCLRPTRTQTLTLPASVTGADALSGVRMVTYSYRGSEITMKIAPARWRPLTATPAELAYFGIPARPSNAVALRRWTQIWGRFKRFAPPGICTTLAVSGLRKGMRQTADNPRYTFPVSTAAICPTSDTGAEEATYQNWAGLYICGTPSPAGGGAYSADRRQFNDVVGQSYGTSENSQSCGPHDAHSRWVGLGGTGELPALLQDGTESDVTYGDFVWWEAIHTVGSGQAVEDSGQMRLQNFAYSPDDVVSLETRVDGVGAGETVTFTLFDQISGDYSVVGPLQSILGAPIDGSVSPVSSPFYDGSTAEWIDERTTFSGAYDKLRNFGEDQWNSMAAYGEGHDGAYQPGETRHVFINMIDRAGTNLASPGTWLFELEGATRDDVRAVS